MSIAVPLAAASLGWIPSSYVAASERLLLRPVWLSLPPMGTLVFVTIGTLIAVVNGARSVSLVRDALIQSERRVQLQRWQLRQLLPEDERAASRLSTAAAPSARPRSPSRGAG